MVLMRSNVLCLQDGECGANLMRLEGPDGSLRHLEGEPGPVYNLFAFPAEDNFAGGLLSRCDWAEAAYRMVSLCCAWP
jgi:hypothetical protein